MIRVENLVKKYGDFTAVNERSVTKPRAAIDQMRQMSRGRGFLEGLRSRRRSCLKGPGLTLD